MSFYAFGSPSCPPRCELALGCPASCVIGSSSPFILPLISCRAGVEGDDISMSTLLKIRQQALRGATSGRLTSRWFLHSLSRNENRISVKDTLSIRHTRLLRLQKKQWKTHTHTFVLKAFSIQYPQCSALNGTQALWLLFLSWKRPIHLLWLEIMVCYRKLLIFFPLPFFLSLRPFFFENIAHSLCYLDENVIIG